MMANLNAPTVDTDVSKNIVSPSVQTTTVTLAVSAQLEYDMFIDADVYIESWLTSYKNSLLWHKRHNFKIEKTCLNSLLLSTERNNEVSTTADIIPILKRVYFRNPLRTIPGFEIPRIHNLTCESLILIKGMPNKACFTNQNVATIAHYLDDNQLLFVTKRTILIIFDPNFCLHETCMPRIYLHGKPKEEIGNTMLLFRRGTNVLYDVSSGIDFIKVVDDIRNVKLATVHFNIDRNEFAGSIEPYVINNKRTHRDVILSRPVSLDPVGIKRLNNKTKVLSILTTAPLYRTLIAQPSDDEDERRPLHHNFRSSGQDISMDQFSFYQPRFTSILQNQSVDRQYRNGSSQQNVAYKNFSTTEERSSSFVGRWPNPNQQQKVHDMVLCGFFYTGNGDLIRCYYCGIGLKDWGATDDPLTEHVRYSPDCQFLIDSIPATKLAHIKASFLPNNVVSTRESIPPARDGYSASVEAATDEIVLSVPPRNPQYRIKAVRISSFSKWPRDMTQTPVELAEAGFFYTGFNDVVRCYVCDGGLQKWSPEDNPWVEHARWFPHCSYVRQIKGEDFIELVRLSAEHQQLEEEGAAGGLNEDTAEQTKNVISDMSGLQISAKNEDMPVSELKEHNMDEILKAVKEVVPECPEAKIKKAIANKEMKGEAVTAESVIFHVTETYAGSIQNAYSPSSADIFVRDPETLEEILEETEKLRSAVKCQDCKERDANCLFLPCAHHRFCMLCGRDVSVCPICKKIIKNKVKTFMS